VIVGELLHDLKSPLIDSSSDAGIALRSLAPGRPGNGPGWLLPVSTVAGRDSSRRAAAAVDSETAPAEGRDAESLDLSSARPERGEPAQGGEGLRD
jgi:hypothetical protein